MPDEISLFNIDELIEFWRKEADDIDPYNCDSMDRPCDVNEHTARKAIAFLPAVLLELKSQMVREREREAADLHGQSKSWLHRLTTWRW